MNTDNIKCTVGFRKPEIGYNNDDFIKGENTIQLTFTFTISGVPQEEAEEVARLFQNKILERIKNI